MFQQRKDAKRACFYNLKNKKTKKTLPCYVLVEKAQLLVSHVGDIKLTA